MADETEKLKKTKNSGMRQKLFQAGFEKWMKDGQKGVFAGFGDPLSKANKKKWNDNLDDDKNDNENDGDGDDGGGGGDDVTPETARPKSNSWPHIVEFNFPKGAGKYYKDGGLVRGGGKATKGRGRGRMV